MEGPVLELGLGRLADAAAGGLLVLAAGSLAVRLGREPVRRVRLVVLTLLGAASLPLLAALPLAPRWSIGPATGEPTVSAPTVAPRTSLPATEGSGPIPPRPASPADPRTEASPTPAAARPTPAEPTPDAATWRPPVRAALATAYGLGAVGWAGWWLVGQLALARASRSARPAPASVRGVLREVAGAGADRVRLLISDRIALPFTFTWARPVILLPASLCDPAEDRALRYALAHEWSHVARRDARAWKLAWLAGLVLFYQPLYWWLRRQLRLCQDFLADDRAAAVGSAEDYAAFLVRLARARGRGPAWPALGIGDRRSNLYRRVVMLVQDREPLETHCRAAWSLAAAASAALVAVAASGLRLDAAPTAGPIALEEVPMPTEPARPAGEALNYKGTVKDKDTGKPIAGATVTVRREISTSAQRRILQETRHVTAEDGTYSFTIPPEQASEPFLYIELDVEHPDYATREGFGYSLGMTQRNEGLGERPFFELIEMRPAKPITGKIEAPDGRPAEGVELLAYSRTDKVKPPDYEYGSFARTKTAADGTFRLPITTPGDGVVWLKPKDFAPEMHALTDGRRGDLGTFRLKPGVKLGGRALGVDGKPVAGLLLEARRDRPPGPDGEALNLPMVSDAISRTAETDAEGRFAFDPLPAGKYRIAATNYDARRARSEGWTRREIPGVFVPIDVTLREGEEPAPLELRESPHVVVEGRWIDSEGRPKSGWSSVLFGQTEAGSWLEQTYPDAKGAFRLNVPRGLKQAQLDISTNEHASVRHRAGKDAPLQEGRSMQLGTLDRDVKDIEIVRYAAPVVVIDAVDEGGKRVAGFQATAAYVGEGPEEARRVHLSGGRPKGGAIQDEQNDGRYRTSQLLPDREVEITATADGFEPASRTLKLPEGAKEEVSLVLKPK